jgi:hypothetical protein
MTVLAHRRVERDQTRPQHLCGPGPDRTKILPKELARRFLPKDFLPKDLFAKRSWGWREAVCG